MQNYYEVSIASPRTLVLCFEGKKWLSLALAYLWARTKRLQLLQWSRQSELLLLWHKLALLPRAQTSVCCCCLTEGALASWPLTCVGCFLQLTTTLRHQKTRTNQRVARAEKTLLRSSLYHTPSRHYYCRVITLRSKSSELGMALSQRTLIELSNGIAEDHRPSSSALSLSPSRTALKETQDYANVYLTQIYASLISFKSNDRYIFA